MDTYKKLGGIVTVCLLSTGCLVSSHFSLVDFDLRTPAQLKALAELERAKRESSIVAKGQPVGAFDPSLLLDPAVAKAFEAMFKMKGRWQILNFDFDYTSTPTVGPIIQEPSLTEVPEDFMSGETNDLGRP